MKGKNETSKYREYLRQICASDTSSSADSFKMADAPVLWEVAARYK